MTYYEEPCRDTGTWMVVDSSDISDGLACVSRLLSDLLQRTPASRGRTQHRIICSSRSHRSQASRIPAPHFTAFNTKCHPSVLYSSMHCRPLHPVLDVFLARHSQPPRRPPSPCRTQYFHPVYWELELPSRGFLSSNRAD